MSEEKVLFTLDKLCNALNRFTVHIHKTLERALTHGSMEVNIGIDIIM
jgi:hypothetical protein